MKQIPNSLNLIQDQVNLILGQMLASLYQDLVNAPVPERLRALLHQLEARCPLG
ncbi:NepR family anti-sigma factor [Microvirga sp. G4-2]|uniref:NepR family anti-sigma factor n=1 Tax=Microvirga sp. G4-2 TaxID=3434467 RepID=UPI0040446CBF